MTLCNSDYHTLFTKILLSNTVTSKTPFYNTSSNSSLPPKYPPSSIFTEIQSKYAKFNHQIHQKGVEWRPFFILPLINNAQGGHVVLDALGRSKDFTNMNTDDVSPLRHHSKPFATTTGRSVLYGPSLTSAFFKIVVAQSCFKQPLFAPARVSRAAPDLASRHR